jgi:hypothetical protein
LSFAGFVDESTLAGFRDEDSRSWRKMKQRQIASEMQAVGEDEGRRMSWQTHTEREREIVRCKQLERRQPHSTSE